MEFLRGKKIADEILKNIKREIKKEKLNPGLAVILVGRNEASEIYARLKKKAAEKVGTRFCLFKFEEDEKDLENMVIEKIKQLNIDEKISGIIVQLPLPAGLDTDRIINSIDPRKDADGFHPENIELFLKNKETIWPVFPKAIIKMIESAGVKLGGKKAVAITKSQKFGEVMKAALEKKGIEAEYVLLDSFPRLERGKIKEGILTGADIIITACGVPDLIKGEMVKKNAVIIDGGITKIGKKVLGDVDKESVKNIVGYVSPVPGGVGPVTVACLLENILTLASKK